MTPSCFLRKECGIVVPSRDPVDGIPNLCTTSFSQLSSRWSSSTFPNLLPIVESVLVSIRLQRRGYGETFVMRSAYGLVFLGGERQMYNCHAAQTAASTYRSNGSTQIPGHSAALDPAHGTVGGFPNGAPLTGPECYLRLVQEHVHRRSTG